MYRSKVTIDLSSYVNDCGCETVGPPGLAICMNFTRYFCQLLPIYSSTKSYLARYLVPLTVDSRYVTFSMIEYGYYGDIMVCNHIVFGV